MTQDERPRRSSYTGEIVMPWYIVTDSDWDWNYVEEGDQPFICYAESPEDAAKKLVEKYGNDMDGIDMKIGEINLTGFQMADKESSNWKFEPFQPLSISPSVKREDVEKSAVFLDEAAKYFERRDTHGEDQAFWANVYNAENARKAATILRFLIAQFEPVRKESSDVG